LQHDDAIGAADGGETMRDYECRAPMHQPFERL
jgi:hypothetical protein